MPVKNRFASLVKRQTLIKDTITLMGSSQENKHIAGFAVVIDEQNKLSG